MEVIIYAAGLGSRLGRNIPKALVEVGGKTLLEHQLSAISKVFPEAPIRIMTGYQHHLFTEQLKQIRNISNPITLHFNPFYECGIIGTAWTSCFAVSAPDILRIDGDVYFTPETLYALVDVTASTLLLSPVSQEKTTTVGRHENMMLTKVEIVKSYQGNDEWVCIERYLNDEYKKIVLEGVKNLPLNSYYYEMLNRKIPEFHIQTRHVSNVYEIDTVQDLQICENYIMCLR